MKEAEKGLLIGAFELALENQLGGSLRAFWVHSQRGYRTWEAQCLAHPMPISEKTVQASLEKH